MATPVSARGGKCPLISILMAVYEPRMDWLREQLDSLNAQTYPNLRLYVRDDCSPMVPFEDVKRLVGERITAFPFQIQRNETNLGSNGTFERLTAEAEGDYFAYCDQDDIWLPEKLSVLREAMEREDARLVCSDMYVIDGAGRRKADSITKLHRRQVFRSGEGLKLVFLTTNFVTGTAMLVRAETAMAAIPFSPYTVHDHYLALCAAREGKIVSLPDRLLCYRDHGGNQTVPMAGIESKAGYFERRIRRRKLELEWLRQRFSEDAELVQAIDGQLQWLNARARWFRGEFSAARAVWKGRAYGPLTVGFELALDRAPEKVFMLFVKLRRRNII